MAQPSVPKFRKPVAPAVEPPKSEAEYMSRSAEVKARGGKRAGRPLDGAVPCKNIGITLPENYIVILDKYADEKTGGNRSKAFLKIMQEKFD